MGQVHCKLFALRRFSVSWCLFAVGNPRLLRASKGFKLLEGYFLLIQALGLLVSSPAFAILRVGMLGGSSALCKTPGNLPKRKERRQLASTVCPLLDRHVK